MSAHGLTNLYFRRPRLLVLTLTLFVVAGLSALQVIPRAEDPEITERFATIFIFYPGASAERVETLITDPVEEEVREIEEIRRVLSTSRANLSTMVLELVDDVGPDESDEIWSRVRDRLGDVDFPEGTLTPRFEKFANAAWTIIYGLKWELPGKPQQVVLTRLAEELADVLRQVNGTKQVRVYGEEEEEITVEVDPARLATYGLTVADVARAVQSRDSKVPAGLVRGSGNQLQIEVAGELDSLARIRDLPIHGGANGRALRLADVGTVRKGALRPAETLALISGEQGVVVATRMLTNRRIDLWSAATREAVAKFERELPRGVKVTTLFDQGVYTGARLSKLFFNFLAAAGLVVVVIFFTMGWRSAILVGSALPLTTLMVLWGLHTFGIPINQMSITGLILALGLLIDNAIVIVDEVRHRLDAGHPAIDAVSRSVSHLFVPLLGSTITTILAFMPIVLMPGPAGEFVGAIGKSVILALVSSFFLAMTVVPALAGRLNNRAQAGAEKTWLDRGLGHPQLTAKYVAALTFFARHPYASLGVGSVLPILGFLAIPLLEEQFFPPADRDQCSIELRLPWQASLEETKRRALAVRDRLLENPEVVDVHWFVGESAPKFYYNFLESRRAVDFYAQALVQLKSAAGSLRTLREIQDDLDAAFPDAQSLVKQLEQGPPFDAPIEVRVYGPDIGKLREIGLDLRQRIAAIPGVTHTRATMEGGQPKLMLDLDEDRGRLAGYDNTAIARILRGNLEGQRGGSMIERTEDLPVRVRVRAADRADVAPVQGIALPGIGGTRWTPLTALTNGRLVPDTATIPHRHGQRINTVQGFLVAGMLPNRVLTELRKRMDADGFSLPPGYRMDFGGEAAERDEAVAKLAGAAFVLLVLMAAALVLSFNSFRMAAIISGVAFLSVGLSTLALFVGGYPLGFMAMVGTMGLIGVAVNDSIVVLAALKDDPAAGAGDLDAIAASVLRNTRHLVSTSLTTIAGFTPLLLGGGGFWPPVAVAIGGGVTGATLLAVTFVPAMFILFHRRRWRQARA